MPFLEEELDPPVQTMKDRTPDNATGFLDSTGWAVDTMNQGKGGKPQSFESQQFVLDYLDRYGMRPTANVLNEWEQQQAPESFTYDPESTMGRLGFSNPLEYSRAQQMGESYGPQAGAFVPWNTGIVTTDEFGNPVMRYMDPTRPEARRAIERGQYINPTWGPNAEQYTGGFPGSSDYYTQPLGPMETLGQEEAIKQFGTPQMYLQGLSDYLDQQVRNDREKVDTAHNQIDELNKSYSAYLDLLNTKIKAGQMTKAEGEQANQDMAKAVQQKMDELYDQIDNVLMTDDRSKREYAKAQDAVAQGTGLQDLPFFNETTPTIWQQAVAEQERQYKTQQKAQPPEWAGYPHEEAPDWGPGDLTIWARDANLSPEWQYWVRTNASQIYALWQRYGQGENFREWVLKYMAR